MYPNSLAVVIIFTILLPHTAIFLPYFTAQFTICWTLCTFDANVATTILLEELLNNLSNTSPTVLSDIVKPFLSALVESDISANTPSFPSSAKRLKSINFPSIGVKSTLKSPVWIIVPTGVLIASITESGILCELWINSTLKYFPNFIVSPGLTSFNFVDSSKLCSSNLFFIKPSVSLVPYIGVFTCFRKYGTLPIWSSWPCVITIPFNFSWFLTIYAISGITISTPSMSSSGNDKPQSTTIISSSYAKTVIFFPTSCKPPSGMIFNFDFLNILFWFSFLVTFGLLLSFCINNEFVWTLLIKAFEGVFSILFSWLFWALYSGLISLLFSFIFLLTLWALSFFTSSFLISFSLVCFFLGV